MDVPEGKKRAGLPRKRAATQRSRHGCLTCRTRRIKCDEGKPTCLKCASSGWKCEGYANARALPPRSMILPKTPAANGEVPLRVTAIQANTLRSRELSFYSTPTPTPTPPPSSLLFQNEDEYRYYNLFQVRTARELSGVFSVDVWGRLVLQACHKEDFVKHAVIAIAALDMTLQNSNNPLPPFRKPEILDQLKGRSEIHHGFALKEYSKALKLMRMATPLDDDESTRNMLLACLLTICFENFHGSIGNAMAQAQIGTKLFNNWINNEARKGAKIKSRISPRPEALETALVCTFARLDLLMTGFQDTRSLDAHMLLRKRDLEALRDMPTQFVSVDQAKYYFELVNRLTTTQQHLIRSRSVTILSGDAPDQTSMVAEHYNVPSKQGPTPGKHSKEYDSPEAMLARLYTAFEPLLLHARSPEGRADFLPATMLLVHWTSLPFIIRAASNSSKETWYDSQLPAMKTCIRLLRQILEPQNDSNKHSYARPRKARFTFEVHYIPVLFGIALKCRHYVTRREAIELLERHPVREGFWDSSMGVVVSKKFMEIEEEGLPWGAHVPEERRLRIIRQEVLLSERRVTFMCARAQVGRKDLELLPNIVIWW